MPVLPDDGYDDRPQSRLLSCAVLVAIPLAVALIVGLAAYVWRQRRAQEAEAAARIEALGGVVIRSSDDEPGTEGPVEEVDLSGAAVTDDDLGVLASLPYLTAVTLWGCPITDEGARTQSGLRRLEVLNLHGARVTDDGLRWLAEMPSLKSLWVGGTGITDEGVRRLAQMPALDSLELDGTEITDAGLAHLVEARSLAWLSCSHTTITDAGLTHVAQMHGLQTFSALGSHVTEEGAARLRAAMLGTDVQALPAGSEEARQVAVELLRRRFAVGVGRGASDLVVSFGDAEESGPRQYQVFCLGRPSFDAAAVKSLQRLTQLEAVQLSPGGTERPATAMAFLAELPDLRGLSLGSAAGCGFQVTDEDMAHAGKVSKLRVLTLAGALPPSGLKQLQPLSELAELQLRLTDVGDAELATLPPLAALERLDLRNTQVSDAGVAHPQKLPRLRMVLFSGPGLGPRNILLNKPDAAGITDRGLAELGKLTGLTGLGLSGCGVTDQGLSHLAKLTDLDHLDLSNTQVGDAGMVHVARLSRLRYLVLDNTGVTSAGLERLRALKGLKRVSAQGVANP